MIRLAVIVPTYNRPAALDRVLESLAEQDMPPAQVIVADDGSGPETAAIVAAWQARMSCPLLHVWQPDEGFRLARARNKAVAAAEADYLVFLDGDCMAFPDFVRRHIGQAESGRFVAGSRLLLGEALTREVEFGALRPQRWGWLPWLTARIHGRVNRLLPLLRLPGRRWRLARSHRWQGARGCNLGIWRRDYVAVNGCDESFEGWGHDDAELVSRLMRSGVLRKEGRFAVPVLHLWHRESNRNNEAANRRRLDEVLNGGRPLRAERGLDSHTADQAG